jgi:predicted metal-dependent enzyme (double-stranded beta helix superfamily)
MGYTLEQLAAECRQALKAEPGPDGRRKVCAIVQKVLADDAFIAEHVADDAPERKILYEDPELGFCILGHNYRGARQSQPHDHGHSWAIYGQAKGETEMTDWELVEGATPDKPGKVRHRRTYSLKPGMAHAYHEGDLHSPRRTGSTKLIRIEGTNMDTVRRLAYEPV